LLGYIRLVGLTTGALVYLFILALILGHRRPRNFERLLFLLTLSIFLIYAAGLLQTNAEIQYGSAPAVTAVFCAGLAALGSLFFLPLVWQTFLGYSRQVRGEPGSLAQRIITAGLWLLPLVAVGLSAGGFSQGGRFELKSGLMLLLGRGKLGVNAGIVLCALLSLRIALQPSSRIERRLGVLLFCASVPVSVLLFISNGSASLVEYEIDALAASAFLVGAVPGAAVIYFAVKENFLDYGSQRNLVYALTAMSIAVLYFALVRRVSGWLEPVLPPEATAAILIFVLIFLFEPLERLIGPVLYRRFRERFGKLQVLSGELRERAGHGDVARLIAETEERIQREFGLGAVRISVPADPGAQALESPGGLGHAVRLPLMKEGKEIGALEAASTGSYLTGETSAALEFLAEQLPAMIDLARLIEEKLRLERELAERERMAVLGQMAASVSHNLRNPLSSMKTVLQVQLENPGLPFDVRHDCALVVDEIDRMSAKLTQLLRFAKPSVNGQRVAAVALAKQTAALFGRDAERRNVRLESACPSREVFVLASGDGLSEVLSNLIVNGMEAQPEGGRVRISLETDVAGDRLEVVVEDDGPGISRELRAKIFEPYFTTKATGTGLGLSIVARRVAEMGGTIACESPLHEGKGTRFRLTLPLAPDAEGGRQA